MEKKDLEQFKNNIKEASLFFKKSERTIRRWLIKYELYQPNIKKQPNKLNHKKAEIIRNLYNNGKTQEEISKIFSVSQASIANIVNKKTYNKCIFLKGSANAKFSTN
jgi:transposase